MALILADVLVCPSAQAMPGKCYYYLENNLLKEIYSDYYTWGGRLSLVLVTTVPRRVWCAE